MANLKSSKKRAKQSEKRRLINVARRSEIKTSTKSLMDALAQNKDEQSLQGLLKEVEAQMARAKNKGTIHKNAAARKVSRLAKKVNASKKSK